MKIIFDVEGKSSDVITIENSDSLTKGNYIFSNTVTGNLDGIDLSSLEHGDGMFENSTLSSETLNLIAERINPVSADGPHTIELGYVSDSDYSIVSTIEGKGWVVSYGGDASVGKYANCETLDAVKAVDPYYQTNDIVNGVWSEPLPSLTDGIRMF